MLGIILVGFMGVIFIQTLFRKLAGGRDIMKGRARGLELLK